MDKEILYKFFDGKADIREKEIIRRWKTASAENEKEFFRERKLFDALLLVPAPEKQITRPAASAGVSYRLRQFLKIAAVIVLTFSGSSLYYLSREDKSLQALQTVTVPAGQRANVTLPDGTSVWLNAGTRIQYPVSFGREKRIVSLDGEAYFEVSKNKKRPFIVQTDGYDIEVLGTVFNVDAYAGSGKFETSLLSGKVSITDQAVPGNVIELHPDTKATLEGKKLTVRPIGNYTHYQWKDGLISFDEASFPDILSELEKCYGVRIVLENDVYNGHKLTGKFRLTDGVEYALRVLQKKTPFTYTRNDEKQIIYIR